MQENIGNLQIISWFLSPSNAYAAISVDVVGNESTRYTPAILSLEDYTLKKFDELTGISSTRVNYMGWIKKEDLEFTLNSL